MAKPRVTKIACDCAGDQGIVKLMCGTCPFCGDTGWMPVDVALRRADTSHVVSFGPYVDSDMSLEELRAEEAACDRVYAMAGVTPPWKEPADG